MSAGGYRILADVVVFIHFLWILFLLAGALWGAGNKVARALHLSGLLFAVVIQVFGWYCPLTHLEFWLNSKHDSTLAYPGSFINYYVEKLVYLELSPTAIFVSTILLLGFNVWVYHRGRAGVPGFLTGHRR